MFGENLAWTRTISTVLGSTLTIDDCIVNEADQPWPHMVLYHINFGYPLTDAGTTIDIGGRSHPPTPRDHIAAAGMKEWSNTPDPIPGVNEQVFRHDLDPDQPGRISITNVELAAKAVTDVDSNALPWVWQWKMPGHGTYVLGIEHSNCPSSMAVSLHVSKNYYR